MNTKEYKNYAFISYQRKDEKWAKWLQRKLENYKLPSVAHGDSSDKPEYIRPVFRDKTDLTGGILSEELKKELRSSRFLIVICSPNSASSDWVNEEVGTFIEDNRLKDIIPFIITGTPRANVIEEECFPEKLKDISSDKEILGINIKENGKDKAFVRTVAYMLGVRFDELWQRHKRRSRRIRLVEIAACFLSLLIILAGYDYKRTRVEYYADYVDVYGVPAGIIELSKEQVSRRNRCWQFEYARVPIGQPGFYSWRLKRVSYVNSAKVPQEINHTELKDRYPIQNLYYNPETGIISRVSLCDKKNNVLLSYQYSERDGQTAAIADFINSQEQLGSAFIGGSHLSMTMNEMDVDQQKTNIVRYCFIRDSEGYIIKQTFHSNNDYQLSKSIICDADGVFGLSYTLDSIGRRIRVQYLGIDGETICTRNGVAGREYEYDEQGNIKKTTYFDLEGLPILNEKKWASCINISDEFGNTVETKCFGADGKLCIMSDGDAMWKSVYDELGNVIESISYDTHGNRVLNKNGFSRFKLEYDKSGNVLSCNYYDEQDNPCMIQDGYSCIKKVYDSNNNPITCSCFDQNGIPCLNKNGWSKCVDTYDKKSRLVERILFDDEGNRCDCKDEFYSRCKLIYDKNGNLIEYSTFDKNDDPCICKYGYAIRKNKYDDRGNTIEEEYYDNNNNLCLAEQGCAKITYKRNEYGSIIEECYYGKDLQRCFNKYGVSKEIISYDEKGLITEVKYFDVNDMPCLSNSSVAIINYSYNTRGDLIKKVFFDAFGAPTLSAEGISREECSFDEYGHETSVSYYDINGNLTLDELGVARYEMKYNKQGNQIETSHFGIKNEPCLNDEGVFRYVISYDSRGNKTTVACYGVRGEPIISQDGSFKVCYCYDEFNRLFHEEFLDVNDNVCLMNHGYAILDNTYDKRGNIIRTDYCDVEYKPCLDVFGRAGAVAEYDDLGFQTKITALGIDGNPIRFASEGWASCCSKYDARGYNIESSYYDEKGDPCMTLAGYHRRTIDYDELGNILRFSNYDTIGNLCLGYDGYAYAQNILDDHHRRIETSYYGTKGEPINADGYHKEVFTLDEYGDIVETTFYDNEMNLLNKKIYVGVVANMDLCSPASYKNIPIGSVIIQCNDWILGMSEASNRLTRKKNRYSSKDYYYLTPENKIDYFHVDKGMSGLWLKDYLLDEEYAKELVQRLNEWKADSLSYYYPEVNP